MVNELDSYYREQVAKREGHGFLARDSTNYLQYNVHE